VFGPTLAARRRMGILAQALGAAYQSTNRQMAMLNDLITEAAALNESMRKFNDIYYSFAARAINYNSGLTNQMLMIEPALLKLYLDNGLRFPLNRICNGLIPQLYAKIRGVTHWAEVDDRPKRGAIYYAWEIFFINNTGASPIAQNLWTDYVCYINDDSVKGPHPPPLHTINDCVGRQEISTITNNPAAVVKQFTSTDKYKLSSEYVNEFGGHFYAKCNFAASGNMTYKYFFGIGDPKDSSKIDLTKPYDMTGAESGTEREVDVSASCYSYTVPVEQVLDGSKIGYFSQKEANALLDQIRIAIDQLNNKLSGLSTVIGVYNQDLQQNYAVATAALEATEEAHQKTTRNIR
jgi:hypothetical protein